jgi:hypothetical protein
VKASFCGFDFWLALKVHGGGDGGDDDGGFVKTKSFPKNADEVLVHEANSWK